MGSTFRPQVDYFVDYLKIQNDYKVIDMNQWMGFYRFCNEISFPEMAEYNPGLSWPLEEWTRGLMALRADTLDKLRKALPELEKEVRTPSNFADFYAYTFRYSLTEEEEQGSKDIETICLRYRHGIYIPTPS
ncbi:hypothetical protein Bca52824_013055 [Brassica carinata]|uniref:Defective in cullin neddylation protein n=1 Tax=Brassica carinata TaxID=52824 RepID=A0A8X8B3J1_BRACI|nr:hypothetical protein Bca52824_013055 [Brassica carinata]